MTAFTWNHVNLPWRRVAGRALTWWLRELAGLLPEAVRQRLAGNSKKALQLEFTRESASLLIPGRDRSSPVIIPISLDPVYRAPFDWASIAGAPVQIRLSEGYLFRPVMELPLTAEASLGSILQHQLERLVPLDPATLRFTWNVVERIPIKNRLKVELCIVKQATIDRATALVRELGLTPQTVLVDGRTQPPAIIWRASPVRNASPREQKRRRFLEVAAACCGLAAYALLVWHLDARREALRDLVTDVRMRTRMVQALSARADSAEKTLAEVNARISTPTALAVLDAVTRAIPLDSSLSEFHFQNGKIEISGLATHATTLLAAIEKEPLFGGASFLTPIVAAGQGTGERFQLGFRLRAESKP